MKKILEAGTKVRIKKGLSIFKTYDGMSFTPIMKENYAGKEMTIHRHTGDGYLLLEDDMRYTFTEPMFDVIEEYDAKKIFDELEPGITLEDYDMDKIDFESSNGSLSFFDENLKSEKGIMLISRNGSAVDLNLKQLKEVQKYINEFVEFAEKRKEQLQPKVKEMTLKEIEEKLGYKVRVK